MARHDPRPINSPHWRNTVRPFIAQRAGFRCEHCFQFLGMAGDVDHIVPRRDIDLIGVGVFDVTNLQYLCGSCHSAKSNRERAPNGPKPPRQYTRADLPGRAAFMAAAGIPETSKSPERN